MGSGPSMLVVQETPFWEREHALAVDAHIAKANRSRVSTLRSPMKLCYVDVQLCGVSMQHWYITDGTHCIEFGDATLNDRAFRIYEIEAAPRAGQVVVKEFDFTEEIRRRLLSMCGATNYSVPLRNSEHAAKYIQCGTWLSLQMVGASSLFVALKSALDERASVVNTLPAELLPKNVALRTTPQQVYSSFKGRFGVKFIEKRSSLASCDLDDMNYVFLGPTGAGKSAIINHLFNLVVAESKSCPLSVTKQMCVYRGSFIDHVDGKQRFFNVIDSVGFCDSVIPPDDVLELVKGFIKANVLDLRKVVIVCSGRIENEHAKAINNFMTWLSYGKHKSEFVFIYNKAEDLSEVEREESKQAMCSLIDADPTYSVQVKGKGSDVVHVNLTLTTGFPRREKLTPRVKEDMLALHNAVFLFRSDQRPLTVSESSCSIL